MTLPSFRGARRRLPGRASRLVLAAVVGTGLVLAAVAPSGAEARASSPAPARAPLDGSMTTSGGAWVDLAMGDLGEFVNTFWQLLYLPAGGSHWSLVTPPGFADNGGIVSVEAGNELVSGFQANQRIDFSPLASTDNGGRSWAPGVLSSPLASLPDALAGTSGGRVVAISGKEATDVVADAGGLSTWRGVITERRLDAMGAKSCGVRALTAVAFAPGGELLVGASCSIPGRVGVFEQGAAGWHLAGPSPGHDQSGSTVSVLRLRSFDGGVSALIEASSATREVLLGTRLVGDGGWSRPVPLALARGAELSASGISVDGGLVVLVSEKSGPVAEVLAEGSSSWTELPRPPARTAAIAFENGGAIDALAVHHSQLTVYRLAAGASSWKRSQVMQVPIQYGSSS